MIQLPIYLAIMLSVVLLIVFGAIIWLFTVIAGLQELRNEIKIQLAQSHEILTNMEKNYEQTLEQATLLSGELHMEVNRLKKHLPRTRGALSVGSPILRGSSLRLWKAPSRVISISRLRICWLLVRLATQLTNLKNSLTNTSLLMQATRLYYWPADLMNSQAPSRVSIKKSIGLSLTGLKRLFSRHWP